MVVLDNLQIYVDSVHFRYEDYRSNKDVPFAVGCTVESIHVQSTNENWEPCFDPNTREIMHKVRITNSFLSLQYLSHQVLELKNLSCYFDIDPKFCEDVDDVEYFTDFMLEKIIDNDNDKISGYVRVHEEVEFAS